MDKKKVQEVLGKYLGYAVSELAITPELMAVACAVEGHLLDTSPPPITVYDTGDGLMVFSGHPTQLGQRYLTIEDVKSLEEQVIELAALDSHQSQIADELVIMTLKEVLSLLKEHPFLPPKKVVKALIKHYKDEQ